MLILTLFHAALAQDTLLLRDVRPVDARGPQPRGDLLIAGDRIAAVGPDLLAPEGAHVIDAGGAFVTPGIIDAHVHISMAPGAQWRPPLSEDEEAARRAHHLRALLSWGVTTFADPGISREDAQQIQALSEQGPSPRPVWIGPILSPPGGYVVDVIPGLPAPETPAQARHFIEDFDAALDPVGVKVTMEDGFIRPVWPLHDDAVLDEVSRTCAEYGLDIYVHANEDEMYRRGLPLAPRAFVHAPVSPLSDAVRDQLIASGTYVITTLSTGMAALLEGDTAHWDDPRVHRSVPLDELATARDPAIGVAYRRAVAALALPRARWLHGAAARVAGSPRVIENQVARMADEIRALHDAGVPLVMGSDSGNWPALPYLQHGPSSLLEIEGLQERAGLSPLDVLTAATWTPAQMLRIDDEVGLVEVGMTADLLLLPADPLEDIRVLGRPMQVIRAGEAHPPADWLKAR
ncbi:MAG: amidohydrolase family protein [Myxococcota bacterium]